MNQANDHIAVAQERADQDRHSTFKAKPATVKVKVRPMKKLKDAARA